MIILKYTCPECGSEHLLTDGIYEWDNNTHSWKTTSEHIEEITSRWIYIWCGECSWNNETGPDLVGIPQNFTQVKIL
jgi:hypothetical protein